MRPPSRLEINDYDELFKAAQSEANNANRGVVYAILALATQVSRLAHRGT